MLGILGLGSRSTLHYLRELNSMYLQKKGGYATFPFLMLNTDFNSINEKLPYVSNELDNAVNKYIQELEKIDVTHLLIPNITLHETIDRLKITKNILHPVHLSIKKAKENNWKSIVLFGSLFSMKSEYIKGQFKSNGIEVILPKEEDMKFIDEVRKSIYTETETKEMINKYHLLIQDYAKENPVVLSCTELSILKPKEYNNLLDMAKVQIDEAIELMHT